MPVRLDKLISSKTPFSRTQIKALIRDGRVCVDGCTAVRPEEQVSPDAEVAVDGRLLPAGEHCYLMLHKPAGVLSAARDAHCRTVVDLVPEELRRKTLFPVGRLDRDTTGLLILTDDGDFAHRVISPKSRIPKVYLAQLDRPLEDSAVRVFAEGVILADGTACLPAKLELLEGAPPHVRVTVFEGKYHQIKRMLGAVGAGVTALHRERIGELSLDPDLPPGACRTLDLEEIGKITSPGKG